MMGPTEEARDSGLWEFMTQAQALSIAMAHQTANYGV